MATIKDVAKKAGVSIATVSRILNKKGKYTRDTENKVFRAIEVLGYSINVTAKSLKTGFTGTIGLVTGEFYLINFPTLLNTIIKVLDSQGFSIEVILNSKLRECVKYLREGKFDGLLITDPEKDEVALKELIERGGDFVFLGGDIEREDVNLVEIDFFQGGYLATKHLINLGHREILFLEDNGYLFFTQEIKRGLLFALDENGLLYNENLIFKNNGDLSSSREQLGYYTVQNILKKETFSAILATEDNLAYGALRAIEDEGLRVPDQVSVIGFGNFSTSEYTSPPLSTVNIPVSDMGELGSEILVNNIKRRDNIIKRVKLKVQLIERKTTAKKLT